MTNFKKMLVEMAHETGKYPRVKSSISEKEWEKYFKTTAKEIKNSKIPKALKVFKSINKYFLTDKNKNYLGSIEFITINRQIIQIKKSESLIEGGFYKIMFPIIFANGVTEILSDDRLSTNVLNSYSKLNSKFNLKIFNPKTKTYIEYDKKRLLSDYNFLLSIKEKK